MFVSIYFYAFMIMQGWINPNYCTPGTLVIGNQVTNGYYCYTPPAKDSGTRTK